MLRNLIMLILIVAATSAWAVSSSLWETQSKDDFSAGEPDGVSIVPTGEVVLGPQMLIAPVDALFAWAVADDSKGNIYAGTGSDGKIFRVSPKGEAEVFAEPELQQVFALLIDKRDVLFAAGFPGGKIFSITTQGEVSEYCDTGQDSVWSLCMRNDGTLFASTGDEGQIFKIESGGKSQLFYDSPERRILSLLCGPDGTLYAGSETNGIIYRIDRDGHPFVLYDTELEEVTSMTMDDEGNLYAVSSPGDLFLKIPPQVAHGAPRASRASNADVGGAAPSGPMTAPGMPAIPSPKKRTCIIYKIAKNGIASKLWASPEQLIFSIVLDGENILAGSGDEGIIYLISPTGEGGTYYKADQKQVLDLHCTASGRIVASTGNVAAVTIFDEKYVSDGAFFSQVHDATTISKWGRVFWEADTPRQTRIGISTRSGNSENPDDTWSDWSPEQDSAEGFVAESPDARYIQWRAALNTSNATKTPELRKVTVAYLQRNLAPIVKSLSVDTGVGGGNGGAQSPGAGKNAGGGPPGFPSGPESGKGPKASKQGVKPAVPTPTTKLKIQWQAEDENGDKLEYMIYFKGTNETNWKLLEEELTESKFEWDTETVPDGEYHVKVIASDMPDNPEATSLTGELSSDPFVIDNTAPVIGRIDRGRVKDSDGSMYVSCTISDKLSPVRSAHYTVDAGDWRLIFPDDGIFDSPIESIEFVIEGLAQGEHTVVVKAIDYFGNVGSGKTTFKVK